MQRAPIALFPLALTLAAAPTLAGDQATYRVEFDAAWSASSHPGAYPPSAHFSPLIGATHSADLSLWAPGAIATPGVELMAETGSTFTLSQEIGQAISAGAAGQVITGGGASAPGSAVATFTVTGEHSLVSLVTMIAPSPDWFVGVHGVDLRAGGQWAQQLVLDLHAYDSGTDSGTSFIGSNQDTSPEEPIVALTQGPFFGVTPLGTFTLTRIASTLEYGCVNPAGSLTASGPVPTLGSSLTLSLDDPTGSLSAPAISFLAFSFASDAAFPCGTVLPNLGLGPTGSSGEVLLGSLFLIDAVGPWLGSPIDTRLSVPSAPSFVDTRLYVQGLMLDINRPAVTNALEISIGA